MNVVIINKSDSTGGAAVVSYRLMQALRKAGVNASMIVAEKCHTDDTNVHLAASATRLRVSFVRERLHIFRRNGHNRTTLFKLDTATSGIDLARHPLVRKADIICLNWVNQGLLSLHDIKRMAELNKPIVWTMHDMWNFTGVCHHAGTCTRYRGECEACPFLPSSGFGSDMAYKTLLRKKALYDRSAITFVPVSNWLAGLAADSHLLANRPITVIPNAFPFDSDESGHAESPDGTIRLLFGAARIDDPIKGFDILIMALRGLNRQNPKLARKLRLTTFGTIRDTSLLDKIVIRHEHLGPVPVSEIQQLYRNSDILVSSSLYETLPGTLVEAQAYGAIPVSFDRGGQADIITDGQTGLMAHFIDNNREESAAMLATAIEEACRTASDPARYATMRRAMFDSARGRFSSESIAQRYISLFNTLLNSR